MNFVTSPPGSDPIIVEASLEASPRRVFEAWTNPDIVMKWFGPEPGSLTAASIDLRPGGRWRFTEHADGHQATAFEGEYLEVIPNELLAFTWTRVTEDQHGNRDATPTSTVEIQFVAAEHGTHLTITHSHLDANGRIGFRVGWEAGTTNLAALLFTTV